MKLVALALCFGALASAAWTRHVIDVSSRGADGTRLLDANGDGLPDIATGWEEGGVVRVYLNPGPKAVREPWPSVTVGRAASPEDAVLVDLDRDGAVDVISSHEGRERSLYVHWAPRDRSRYLDAAAWTSEPIPAAKGARQWMFVASAQIDGKRGVDFFAGAKGDKAALGWFEAPANPRDLAAWKWHELTPAGWIMSVIPHDMDGDGDIDVLASDRRNPLGGSFWMENPGGTPGAWPLHRISDNQDKILFLGAANAMRDIVAADQKGRILWHRRKGAEYQTTAIPSPATAGTPKHATLADLDGDGQLDIVFSCEHATGEKSGLMYLAAPDWRPVDVSGAPGTKYDLVVPIDLDGDGDLDLLTSEEVENLGVIWYENPLR